MSGNGLIYIVVLVGHDPFPLDNLRRIGYFEIVCPTRVLINLNGVGMDMDSSFSSAYEVTTHPGILSLKPYVPGKAIEELAREQGLTNIIKLASNENPLGCSPLAKKALDQMSVHQLALYPSPLNHPLYDKLAAQFGIDRRQLILSNGSDFLFWYLLTVLALGQDKCMVTHQFAFSTYAIQAQTLGIPVITTPVDTNYAIDIDAMLMTCQKHAVAIIFIANPNNPTGVLTSRADILRLLEGVPKTTVLVLDEAYHEYAYPQGDLYSLELQRKFPNLVLTRTFSKIYGLAGLRLGYAIADPAIIELLLRVQLPFTVNQPALVAAYAALDDFAFLERTIALNHMGLTQMREGLDILGVNYLPSHTNFLTINCGRSSIPVYEQLLSQGIIVRPLIPYGLMNHLRVTIGTEAQNERFLKQFKRIIQN